MAINRINETDLQGKLVSQLSNRPTDPRSAGGDNMTAQEVKARHDALGLLVKDKLNELLDALNNATVDGEPVTPLSDLITVVADGVSKSLTAWIEDKYSLPLTGIPKSDLSDGVKASLDLADSAYQLPETGIPADDLANAVKTILTNALLQSDADMSATGGKLGRRDYSGVMHGATYGASAIDTALVNKGQFEPVKALAEGASQAAAAENYSALVGILSDAPKTKYKAGQRFLIGTYGVPDVGILSVEDTAVSYTYTTDAAFEASLMAGTLQIGYFVLRPIEGKTNLEDYSTTAETNEAISAAIDLLVDALVDGVMAVAEADYAESATFAQQAYLANQINTDREIEDAETACPPAVFGTVGGNAEVQSGLMRFTEVRGHTIKSNQTLLSSKSSSVDFIKRNQWDEEWLKGAWVSGGFVDSSDSVASKNAIEVLPNTTYYSTAYIYVCEYDGNGTFIQRTSTDHLFTTTANTLYIRFNTQSAYGTTYKNDICIYINWETPGLPYVPYSKQHITLPNIELRSVGDVYDVAYQTGGGKRRIGERAYQSGDENDPDVLTDGTTTLYVLTTETDITVEENPGWDEYAEIDNFGTVKFNQDPAQTVPVPQAYFVRYVVNLVEFLDSLYVHCGGDVSKIALVE